MYIDLNTERMMSYYCKQCSNREDINANESICVIDINHVDDDTIYQQFINKNLKYDNTLPRVTNIECVNPSCNGKAEKKGNLVIVVKYDFTNMKYLYNCEHCGYFWKIGKKL